MWLKSWTNTRRDVSMDGGNGERGENGHSKAAREADSEGIEEDVWPADGFLRFSSVRVSWIWRILVCSPPKALRLLTVSHSLPLYFSFSPSFSNDSNHGTERSRTKRTSYLPVLPDGCCISAGGETEWKRSGKGKTRRTRRWRGRNGPVVRNTCLRELVLRVCPSIRDQAEATMYYHRWQSISSNLSPRLTFLFFFYPLQENKQIKLTPAGARLVAFAPDFGMRAREQAKKCGRLRLDEKL